MRKFDTFTPSIREMCGYISSQGVEAVGMESTGIYIDPIWTVLRQSGMKAVVAVARKLLVTIYAIHLKRQEYRPDVVDKDSDDRMFMRRLQYHIAQCQKLQRIAPKLNDENDSEQDTFLFHL